MAGGSKRLLEQRGKVSRVLTSLLTVKLIGTCSDTTGLHTLLVGKPVE